MTAWLIFMAVVFGLCYLADRAFTKLFRSAPQHKSGQAVRMHKRVALIGIGVLVLGVLGILSGIGQGWLLPCGGGILTLTGVALLIHYLSFGVYYDEDSFVLSTFGRKSAAYRFADIQAQQLYNGYGRITVELHLSDGRTLQLQDGMEGRDRFLDKAFAGWLQQRGRKMEDCPFHDPENSCWFPNIDSEE